VPDPLFVAEAIDRVGEQPKSLLHCSTRILVETLHRLLAGRGELQTIKGLVERRREVSLRRIGAGLRDENVACRRLQQILSGAED
jgi:hypothetical protein